jgi:hypothetical protein
MPKLSEQWQSYFKKVMPNGGPSIQVQECRRAFYAGAFAALMLVEIVGAEDVSAEAGVAYIQSLIKECRDFNARVGVDL